MWSNPVFYYYSCDVMTARKQLCAFSEAAASRLGSGTVSLLDAAIAKVARPRQQGEGRPHCGAPRG